jgi:competence protein ComEA
MDRLFLSLFVVSVLMAGVAQTHAQTASGKSESRPLATVNLNTATAAELETLPGIGASTAARILEYRQKNGPFKKIEELMNVQGVGEKSFLKLRQQITVAAKPEGGRPQQ